MTPPAPLHTSFSTDTYFKCPDTWGIAPMQILPDKFSTLTTSISDSAPQIGNRPLRKRPHLWGHISIQPAVLNGKKKILSHLTLCFSVIIPVMSICGPHYGLFPSVFMPAKTCCPLVSQWGNRDHQRLWTAKVGTPSSLLRSILIISIRHNPGLMMKAELNSISAGRQILNPDLAPSMGSNRET